MLKLKRKDPDLFIHIGPPKSGTSAIQYFLHTNREILERCGFHYPEHGIDRNNISGGHSELGLLLTENKLEQATGLFKKYLNAAKKKKVDLLLSAESFYINPEKFKQILSDFSGSITIIAFFRDPLETIYSSYSQLIKRHFFKGTFEHHFKTITQSDGGYFSGKILHRWIDSFGLENCKIHPYDFNVFINHRIEYTFLNLIDIDLSFIDSFSISEKKINKSYTHSALELKRLINSALDEKHIAINAKIDRALQHFSDNSPETRRDYREILTTHQRNLIREKFKNSNKKILDVLCTSPSSSYLTYDASPGVNEGKGVVEFTLPSVYSQALSEDPSIYEFLSNRTLALLQKNAENSSLNTLAEILKLPQKASPTHFFSTEQLSKIMDKDATLFTMIIALVTALEKKGHIEEALQLADRALELRPNGKMAKALHSRLKQKNDA